MHRNLRTMCTAAAFVAAALPACIAGAAWPEKTVRIIIPWPPGGSTDIVGRLLAADLTRRFKQQFVIDNRAGAASIIGMQISAAAPPDGYTFMITSTAYGHLINKSLAKGIDYVTSYEPVALLGFGDSALVVHPSLPVSSVRELVALAKKRPGELNYASSGVGGFPHMNTELFKLMTGTNIVHVPFQGGGPALADTMAGNTQMLIVSLPTVMPHASSGRLRLLGVGGKKRSPQLPDVPTISESGVPGFVTYIWWGTFAPLKTPQDVIRRMHAEIIASLESPEMQSKLEPQGANVEKMSPQEFGKVMIDETNKWLDVIRRAGIKGE